MNTIEIGVSNYKTEVVESEKSVLLFFYGLACPNCHRMAPCIEEVAGERTDIKVGVVNCTNGSSTAQQYNIYQLPAMVFLRNYEVTGRANGYRSKEELLAFIEEGLVAAPEPPLCPPPGQSA